MTPRYELLLASYAQTDQAALLALYLALGLQAGWASLNFAPGFIASVRRPLLRIYYALGLLMYLSDPGLRPVGQRMNSFVVYAAVCSRRSFSNLARCNMKRKAIPTLLVLALLLAATVIPAAADKPVIPGQLNYIDAQIDVFVPRLMQYQLDYRQIRGKYFQSLISHDTPPEEVTAPDQTKTPTDQTDTDLNDLWTKTTLNAKINWAFKIDVYDGPSGQGYVLTVVANIKGDTWTRSINYGPAEENWRTVDWYQVIPDELP